jgi:WD40 repeat protein
VKQAATKAIRAVQLGVVAIAVLGMSSGPRPAAEATALPGDAMGGVHGGAERWVSRYDGTDGLDDSAAAVGVSPDGSTVLVTGASEGSGTGTDYATAAYDSVTGMELWVARYDGPAHAEDTARALAVSDDGARVFVTGSSSGSHGINAYATVAYDLFTGTELWAMRNDGRGRGFTKAVAVDASPDGSRVFVTGGAVGSNGALEYVTLAYDAASGASQWRARYDGPSDFGDVAAGLDLSPDGSRVFVTGYSGIRSGESVYGTIAYDALTGRKLWVARYGGKGQGGQAAGIRASPDGSSVFVTGYSAAPGEFQVDFATVAYDASTGETRWDARYDGPAHLDDLATALSVGPDGSSVFVTGFSDSSNAVGFATLAYDASTGAQLWVARSKGSSEYAITIAAGVSPDGSEIFVAGRSLAGADLDVATAAYDTVTGGKRWSVRYDGPDNLADGASGLAVSPNGTSVYVTGYSWATNGDDYLTIAYTP